MNNQKDKRLEEECSKSSNIFKATLAVSPVLLSTLCTRYSHNFSPELSGYISDNKELFFYFGIVATPLILLYFAYKEGR